MSKSKPILILTHYDLDAGSSAICIINYITQKYGPEHPYSYWFGNYDKVDAYVERILDVKDRYEEVIIADISCHPDLAKEMPDSWKIYDHHPTTEGLQGLKNCIIDTSGNACGASLCYKHLLKDNRYEYKHLTSLVAITNDYDNYRLKLPNNVARNLNFLFYYYWQDKFIERFKGGFDGFNEDEKEFLKQKWIDIGKEIASTNFIDVMDESHKNKFCMIVMPNKKGEVNELCDHALTKLGYAVVMTVNPLKNKISVRVSKDAAAKNFHIGFLLQELQVGGGHAQAGGGQYGNDSQLEVISEAIGNKIIELGI